LNGEVRTARTKQSSPIIPPIRRFHQVINSDKVFGTHTGEYVSPGVPLVTLVDLNDLWIHFDLREENYTRFQTLQTSLRL
jgi:HlyD family secretion protein